MAGLIAAALTVPVLLLFYFLKLRRRQVRVSSTLLWANAMQDMQVNTPFRWLRVTLLLILISKTIYMTSFSSYYMFYLIHKFGLSTQSAQVFLFIFLAAGAAGILIGGQVGDRFSRKHVIWFSVVGALPFALLLPYANLMWTAILSALVGMTLNCSAASIIVYAQELMPRHVGAISGMFYGFAFGVGGLGAAALGLIADSHGIDFVYGFCALLPLLGFVAVFLPNMGKPKRARA